MDELRLRNLFSGILGVSLCSPLVLVAGCDEAKPPPAPLSELGDMGAYAPDLMALPALAVRAPDGSAPLCRPSADLNNLGFSVSRPVDYIEVGDFGYVCNPLGCTSSLIRAPHIVAGTECGNATDPLACQASLTQKLRDRCTTKLCTTKYLANTYGDTAQVLTSFGELLTFLTPIDSGQEALAVAWWSGYDISCTDKNIGDVSSTSSGYEVAASRGRGCSGEDRLRCLLDIDSSGTVTEKSCVVYVKSTVPCYVGRRPAGLCGKSARSARTALGRHFAEVAHFEAAAVAAFAMLHAELAVHGAPVHLRSLAERARRDEIRHAAITAALARRYGGRPSLPRVSQSPLRSLEEIAQENAVEGCVSETYGALLASFQAVHAADPAIRSAMSGIAEDETRHAALSWQVAMWAERKLGASARARLKAARRRAIEVLRADNSCDPNPECTRIAGLPTAEQAAELIGQMERQLWAHA